MLFLFKDYSDREAILDYSYRYTSIFLQPNMKHGLTLQQKMFITTKKLL